MKSKLLLVISLVGLTIFSYAQQTPAGNCFFMNYASWNAGTAKPPMYINCGNNNVFNTGYELTLECWIRVENCAWNQKIMGKMDNLISNGYVMGMEAGKNYSELFTPLKNEVKFGDIPLDSAWVHMAVIYASGSRMIAYINGIEAGSINVSNNSIVGNDSPFIIGNSPWDLASLQTFGHIDEVRVWSVARTADEIKNNMHKHIVGDEAGLVAYYDFNLSTGLSVPDLSANGNTGTVSSNADAYWSWAPSYAAVGNSKMYAMTDVLGVWYGLCKTQDCFSAASGGMTVMSKIPAKHFDYAVFGHNDSLNITSDDTPTNATNFKRLKKVWYFNKGGNVNADLMFNLNDASGLIKPLGQSANQLLYTLLVRNDSTGIFTPTYCASQVISSGLGVKFSNVPLDNKYYTVGFSSNQIGSTNAIDKNELLDQIMCYPNPANNTLNLMHCENATINLIDVSGRILKTENIQSADFQLNISNIPAGFYYLKISKNNSFCIKKIVKQ